MKKSIAPIAALALAGLALFVFIGLDGRKAEAQAAVQMPLAGSAVPSGWTSCLPRPLSTAALGPLWN